MYLDSYSDYLTSFCEPLYRHHTGLKNVYGNHLKIVWGSDLVLWDIKGVLLLVCPGGGGGGGLKVVPGYVTKDSWVGGYRRVFDMSQMMMLSGLL